MQMEDLRMLQSNGRWVWKEVMNLEFERDWQDLRDTAKRNGGRFPKKPVALEAIRHRMIKRWPCLSGALQTNHMESAFLRFARHQPKVYNYMLHKRKDVQRLLIDEEQAKLDSDGLKRLEAFNLLFGTMPQLQSRIDGILAAFKSQASKLTQVNVQLDDIMERLAKGDERFNQVEKQLNELMRLWSA